MSTEASSESVPTSAAASASAELLPMDAGALELRVLSGLQSGAALPLDDTLTVGSGEDADLLLLDEGIAAAQLRIGVSPDGGLEMVALADGIGWPGRPAPRPGERLPLAIGEAVLASTVWLMVRGAADPWPAWSPPAMSMETASAPAAPAIEAAPADEDAPAGIMSDVRPAPRRKGGVAPSRRPMRGFGNAIVAAGLLSTMLGVAALVRQATDDSAAGTQVDTAKATKAKAPSGGAMLANGPAAPPAVASAVVPAASGAGTAAATDAPMAKAPPSAAPVRRDGRDRLIVQVPGEDPVALPFDIREVLLGGDSHVVLTDGRRLEPGDHAGEWRLAAIQPGALVFDGPRTVRIGW